MLSRAIAVSLALLVAPCALAGATLVPTPPLIADGNTPATLHVLLDTPGSTVRVKPERGRVGSVTYVDGGALVELLPPAVREPGELALDIKVRGATKEDIRASVALVPSWKSGFDLSFDPPSVRAGETATVRVVPTAKTAQADSERALQVVASVGTVTAPVPTGDGTWLARYTAPSGAKEPLQAAFTVVDAAAPFQAQGHGHLPVVVERSISLDAPAGSNNVLVVGNLQFGPVTATPGGKVAFQVPVDPEWKRGVLQTVTPDGQRTDAAVDLPIQAGPSFVLAPLPAKGPGGSAVPVTVYAVQGDGGNGVLSQLQVAVQGGTVTGIREIGPGVGQAIWTLPASGRDTVSFTLDGQKASATIDVVPAPVTVTLSADPPALGEKTRDLAITARVKDASGKAVVGRTPRLTTTGAYAIANPRDGGDGTYTGRYRLSRGSEEVVVLAAPDLAATGLPPRRVLLWPVLTHLEADGSSKVELVVVAEDALGMPVPNVEITLAVPQGDAAIAPTLRIGRDGIGRVHLKAGTTPGTVAVEARVAGLTGTTAVYQVAEGASAPPLHPTGSSPWLKSLDRWKQTVPTLVVGPQPPAPVVAAAAPGVAPPTSGDAAPAAAAPPTAGPSGPAARTPRPPRQPGQVPWLRLRAGVANQPFRYASELDGVAEDYAPEAAFSVSPLFGAVALLPEIEGWFLDEQILGVDVRARFGLYRVRVGTESFTRTPLEFSAGARYRFWQDSGVALYGGAGFARSSALVFGYTDESKTAAALSDRPLMGARVAAGARYEQGDLLAQLELSELFSPFPVVSRADLTVDVPLDGPLDLTLGAAGEYRTATVEIAEKADMRVTQVGWEIRGGIVFALK